MTWSSPATGKTFFETSDIPTQGNFSTYIFDNLLAISHPYDYASADVDVVNTTTETSLWSKLITGGDMGSNGLLFLELQGDFLYNNSTLDTINVRVKFGGTTHVAAALNPTGAQTSSSRCVWRVRMHLANKGATNAQWLMSELTLFSSGGTGGQTTLNFWNTPFPKVAHASPAVDTTADQTLQVTAQWSTASTNNSWRKRMAALYLAQN